MFKIVIAALAVVLGCAACAGGASSSGASPSGASPSGAGSGSITMYGTVDEGITLRK